MTCPVSSQFGDLLARALSEPGIISRAYSAFHGYSIGNQLLALVQCVNRGLNPGPLATYQGWLEKGRQVKKGERAIALCMPVTCRRKSAAAAAPREVEGERDLTFTRFVHRNYWFVLSQTDGEDRAQPSLPTWDRARALGALHITEEAFSMTDGNCQGYARERTIAVSPLAELPHKTRFHELAHVVLGHTAEGAAGLTDSELTPRSLRELEAEAVALICLEALGLAGAEHCRGYIQHWNASRGNEPLPERSAQRVFKAADTILKAGEVSASPVEGGHHV